MASLPDYDAMPEYWNAYVISGATRDERRERLERVPERFRAGVESHVRTAFAIRQRAAQKPRGVSRDD